MKLNKDRILSLWSIIFEHRSSLVDAEEFKALSSSMLVQMDSKRVKVDLMANVLNSSPSNESLKGSLEYASVFVPLILCMAVLTRKIDKADGIEFGFDELKSALAYYKTTAEDKDFDTRLNSKGYRLRGVSISDYCSKFEFLEKDLVTLCNLLRIGTEEDNILEKKVMNYYKSVVDSTVNFVLNVYSDLFASGYEVLQPFGVLSSSGCLTVDPNDNLWVSKSMEFSSIYSILSSKLKLEEFTPRDFQVSAIDSTCLDGNDEKIAYFPYKLLEYALGRKNASECNSADVYTRHSSSVSWSRYKDDAIVTGLRNALMATVISKLKLSNLLGKDADGNELHTSTTANQSVRVTCNKFKYSVTNCILISQWKAIGDSGEVIGFKIRAVDMNNNLSMGTKVVEEIIDQAFSGNKGGSKTIPPAEKRGDFVKEFSFQFDPVLCEAEPLFAYVALDSLKRRGIKPSWRNLILGKNDNDKILSASSSEISLDSKLVHEIVAGSRSGKGVMTLNILASAIASKKPIFYCDRKPDMASLMKYLAKGKMFVINGGAYGASDDQYNMFGEDKAGDWSRNIPEYVASGLKCNVSSYNDFGDLFYLRAMMFAMGIIQLRYEHNNDAEVMANLGGKDGVIFVFDEFSNTCLGLNRFLDCRVGSITNGVLGASGLATAEKDGSITPWNVYASTFIEKLNDSFNAVSIGMSAGWKQTEVTPSNIFVLGQEVLSTEGEPSFTVNATKGVSKADGQNASILQKMLLNCEADGFFGYNIKKPTYLNVISPASKGHTRLTSSARNFAYVPALSNDTMNLVVKGDKAIADSAVYFKPFLILNNADESGTYVTQFKKFCEDNKVSYTDIKSIHHDENGNLEPRIGFEEYIKSQSPDVDIASVLRKSYDIGNYIINKMGYHDGDIFDFLFDLRPEWMFSIKDMALAFNGKDNISTRLSLFTKYAPDLVSATTDEDEGSYISGKDNVFNSNTDYSTVNIPELEHTEAPVVDNSISEDNTMLNNNSVVDDPLANRDTILSELNSSDSADNEQPVSTTSNEGYSFEVPEEDGEYVVSENDSDFSNNGGELSTDEDSESAIGSEFESSNSDSNSDFNDINDSPPSANDSPEVASMKAEIKSLKDTIAQLQAFMMSNDMQSRVSEAKESIKNVETPQERVLTEPYTCRFFDKVLKIQQYNDKLNIPKDFTPSDDFEESARSFKSLSTYLLNDISAMFGGLDRITDFAVMSNVLVINSIAYSPQVPSKFINSLPLDVRNDVKNGRFAWIFDFDCLKSLPNLTNLMFNDTDFVYKKVRIDLHMNKDFEPKNLFSVCQRLNFLQLGEYQFVRGQKNAHDNVFHESKRSTEIADAVESWGINTTKSNWQSVKSIYRDPEKRGFWKGVQVVGMTGVTAVTGAGTVGVKAGRTATRLGKRMFGGIMEVVSAMRKNS